LLPLPGQSGVLIGLGGRPALLELFADETLLVSAWPRILAAAARGPQGHLTEPPAVTSPANSSDASSNYSSVALRNPHLGNHCTRCAGLWNSGALPMPVGFCMLR
jgi:hypothetical protein